MAEDGLDNIITHILIAHDRRQRTSHIVGADAETKSVFGTAADYIAETRGLHGVIGSTTDLLAFFCGTHQSADFKMAAAPG